MHHSDCLRTEEINGAIVADVTLPESGSTSAKTGLALSRTALEAVAIKVRVR